MENEIYINITEEINSIVPMETDFTDIQNYSISAQTQFIPMETDVALTQNASMIMQTPTIPTAESSDSNSFSTPTCSDDENDEFVPVLHYSKTPGGSEQWFRTVEDDFTPKVGMFFLKLEDAVEFYCIYALGCGFDVRKYTNGKLKGDIEVKSVVCNRQGHRDMKRKMRLQAASEEVDSSSTTGKKKTLTRQPKVNKLTRCGCQAKIRFQACPQTTERPAGYIVDQFREVHNHPLYSVKNREFQKLSRDVHDYIKRVIIDHTKLNIGPTLSYRILKEYAKEYKNVGACLMDFKNFKRDVKCYIGDNDASMFIANFKMLAETQGYYFAYELDEDKCLTRVFWADQENINNYKLFGDTISFDPTYGTNKYFMVFTPFTGVDHNKKTVTFGAGLLEFENQESFEWIFSKFLEAMGQKQPQCVITDQCPGIKKACPKIFDKSIHKYCMWHIMQKMPEKVGRKFCNETDFMTDINSVVWDIDLEPDEFEKNWEAVVSEYGLQDNQWLNYLFRMRRKWIPAYYRDFPLGCLLRTTQRSESSNSYFKRFESHYGTLVEFWMRFTSAMEQQRHVQRQLDTTNEHSRIDKVGPMKIEDHASAAYTHAIFSDFQREIKHAICSMGVGGLRTVGVVEYHLVKEASKDRKFLVEFNTENHSTKCDCKNFERRGFVCRHIIWVWNGSMVYKIPDEYMLPRWTKKSYRAVICDEKGRVVEDYNEADLKKMEMSNVWSEFYAMVGVLETSATLKQMKEVEKMLKEFREKIKGPVQPVTKDQKIEALLGMSNSNGLDIRPPHKAKNKGSGKRIKTSKEKALAIKKKEKRKRRCGNCKKWVNHNSRTCTLPFAVSPPSDDDEEEGEEEEEAETEEEEDSSDE